jgi:large subunit ribosomal protein L24
MSKIKKGDTVLIIAGKDKGLTGKVLDLDAKRILIEGVNRVQRHTKVTTGDRGIKVGGIVHVEASIAISNVMLVDEDGKASRLGARKDENGKNVRISRRTGKDI